MEFPVYATTELVARLNALNLAAYPDDVGTESRVRLYKNDVTPDANMVPATFTECDFVGYVPKDIVMSVATLNDQGLVNSRSNLCSWLTAAGADPSTVYGVFVTSRDGTSLIAAQRFDEPQQIGGALPQSISGVWRTSEPLTSMGWLSVE